MSLIQQEAEKARRENFVLIRGTKLVRLCLKNVAKAESIIQNDSSYMRSSDKNQAPRGNSYAGSTAYWMTRLKELLIVQGKVRGKEFEEVVRAAVAAVDRDNSTHLNADGVGREEISKRIIKFGPELVDSLQHPAGNGYALLNRIAEKTSLSSVAGNCGRGRSHRENISFASKFCHYACFYLFEGSEAQDNFSIYDNIVLEVLPYYLVYYNLYESMRVARDAIKKNYVAYQKGIDDIRMRFTKEISRNGFDHLLWYYYKGRLPLGKEWRT